VFGLGGGFDGCPSFVGQLLDFFRMVSRLFDGGRVLGFIYSSYLLVL